MIGVRLGSGSNPKKEMFWLQPRKTYRYYEDLLLGMNQWLSKCTVNAVIIVDIKEAKKPIAMSSEGKSREKVRLLLGRFGNAEDKRRNNMDGIPDRTNDDEDDQSSPNMYATTNRKLSKHTNELVGDLKVTVLEEWEHCYMKHTI